MECKLLVDVEPITLHHATQSNTGMVATSEDGQKAVDTFGNVASAELKLLST
jgi:hypothetical protein